MTCPRHNLQRVPYAFTGKPLRERRIQPAVIRCPSERPVYRLINVVAVIGLLAMFAFLAGFGRNY